MIAIKVPPLGESIVEATVSRWAKQPGDPVAAGETVVELDTDKVTVEVPALKSGVLASQAKHEGDTVKVDDLLGEVDETAAVPAAASVAGPAAAPAVALPAAAAPSGASSAPVSAATTGTAPPGAVRAAPSAQRLASKEGVDLARVSGTGRGGVVSKPDVIDHLARASAAPPAPLATPAGPESRAVPAPAGPNGARTPAAPEARETREKMTTRRKRIADNLVQAQHITAHLTTFNEIDMSAVTALRNRMRERVEQEQGVKLTFMPFFVKAACIALRQFPVVNAQIDADTIVYKHYVNMGIAVASEAGLVVPVIRDADQKGIIGISREIADVATRARAGKLAIDDLTGGTFTITNGGVFGSLVSTPILNYPQSGILGLHKIQDRPVAERGAVVVRAMMYVALSYDHRLVDGQQAVLFLVRIKELIEDPAAMLVA
ncbi:MAG: 2-oxoglutarate dehydrogenase complex dihydrolipoyllysine-residue succinyltransferase [Gemmatimonadales bacterium]|jgi:2-oxoglutarate dehydrogenase E2 component (dihydrolipoamide succinyltransferase)